MQQLDIRAFQEKLEATKKVLILLPQNPDVDAVSAALSLKLAFEVGRDIMVACVSPMTVEFNRLVGVDTITDNPGNKNLIIEFDKTASVGVDRVTWESAETLKLVVVPKQGQTAPTQNQISLNYVGVEADLIIVVKAKNKAELGSFGENPEIFTENAKVVVVSNFPSQGFTTPVEVIDPQVTSTTEVVFELLEAMAVALTPDVATNLLQGLRAGTNAFQNITTKTFAVASSLVGAGANSGTVAQQVYSPLSAQLVDSSGEQLSQDWPESKSTKGTPLF